MPEAGRVPRRASPHRHREASEVPASGPVLGGLRAPGQLIGSAPEVRSLSQSLSGGRFRPMPGPFAPPIEHEWTRVSPRLALMRRAELVTFGVPVAAGIAVAFSF